MRTKRLLASVLVLLMLCTLLPATALAEEPEAAPSPDETQYDGLVGWFLVGSMNGWTPTEEYRFTWNNGSPLQFIIQCNLSAGDEFKGVLVESDGTTTWFPDPGNNYVVNADQAGYKAVYFRPYDTDEWGSNFQITDLPTYHVSTSVNSPVHGSLSVSPEDAHQGDTVTVTVTPDEGYVLQYIEPSSITKVNDTTYTFVMPGNATTVYATFKLGPGFYFDNTGRVVPNNYVPEEKFSPSTSLFGEWEREAVLTENEFIDVMAVYTPELATERMGYSWCFQTTKLTYSSSSNRPKVTAEQAGHAMVFLTETEREGYTKAIHCDYTYKDPSFVWDAWWIIKSFHAITVETAENGSAAADLTEAYEGQTVTLTATPASGYRLGAYTVLDADGNEIPVEGNSFAMPDGPVTVTASFIPEGAVTYTVIVDANIQNGSVTPDKTSAADGEAVNLTVTPDEGYQLETLTVTDANGGPVELNGTSFLMPAANVTVTATFVLIPPPTYTVTVDARIQNGSVTADKATALEGETVSLTVTPAPGYELSALTVTDANGSPVALNGSSFVMPASNVTVTASFVPVYYTVTVLGSAEGCTVVADKATAGEGETVTITVTNDNDHRLHEISAVDANGVPVELTKIQYSNTKYTFTMPAADVTVTAVTKAVYDLRVGATQVDSLNMADVLGDGTVSYDPASHTLTMTSPTPAYLGQYSTGWVSSGMPELIIDAPNGLQFADPEGSVSYAVSTYNNGDLIINGDVELAMPYSNGIYSLGGLTVNGNVSGNVNAFVLYGSTGITVNGNVSASNNDYIRAVYCVSGDITINGSFGGNGFGIDANAGSISVTGGVSIGSSTNANNYGLKAAGSVGVGGDFSFSGKAAYTAYAGQDFSCGGDVTVANTQGQGIYANAGTITVVGGTWDVQARSNPLKAAGGIAIPGTHAITEPAGGLLAETEGFTFVTEADGTPATHVIIEEAETPDTITIRFDAGTGTVEPASVQIEFGAAIGQLPTPTREGGWVFLGWYMTPAATQFEIGQGTEVTAESTFDADATVYAHWRLPGDVNGDGQVNTADVSLLAKYVKARGQGVTIVPFSGNVDGDADGKATTADVSLLAKYVKARGQGVVIH